MKQILAAAILFGAAPVAAAAEIQVSYAPEFSEKLEEDYGEREGTYLTDQVREDLEQALAKAGADVARVEVTIVDAKPSRPTFKQATDLPGLDIHRSVSLGGMELRAVAYGPAGTASEPFEYEWYETDIAFTGIGTWRDARRASSRFATRFADKVN
jgi:hypothetical protein